MTTNTNPKNTTTTTHRPYYRTTTDTAAAATTASSSTTPASSSTTVKTEPAASTSSSTAPATSSSSTTTTTTTPPTWTGSWNNTYKIPAQNVTSYQQGYSYQNYNPQGSFFKQDNSKQKPRSPSPDPPTRVYKHWDSALKAFLSAAGLTQALRGFEMDMLVLNPEWEKRTVAPALDGFVSRIQKIREGNSPELPLEIRKLEHVNTPPGTLPRSQSTINKSISLFLAQSRARNDASNRAEFLESIAEKRRRLNEEDVEMDDTTTCARADAKPQDRDSQMKYDITKNEDGPLRRTLRRRSDGPDPAPVPSTSASASTSVSSLSKAKGKQKSDVIKIIIPPIRPVVESPPPPPPAPAQVVGEEDRLTAERYPGLAERVSNLESHLAIRYVPGPPRNLLAKLKFLEDHIIKLEKEYPPWAALHFNQPGRGWPPPPRSTPIIVPTHMLTIAEPPAISIASTTGRGARTKTSLQRAVQERLQVEQAKNELSGPK